MSITADTNFSRNETSDFVEGVISFGAGQWFCISHQITMNAGRECPWCVFETCGEAEFFKWAARAPLERNRAPINEDVTA